MLRKLLKILINGSDKFVRVSYIGCVSWSFISVSNILLASVLAVESLEENLIQVWKLQCGIRGMHHHGLRWNGLFNPL